MAPPSIPSGSTVVQTFKKSFTDIPVDEATQNAIPTTEFLEAAESFVTLFDGLGSVAFAPVKADMLFNVKRIRDRQTAFPDESKNVQDLCRNEIKAGKHDAADGLLWLVRCLEFAGLGLHMNITNPKEELSTSFRASYKQTLKPFHGFLIKPLFSAAMSACPYRKAFYAQLGSDLQQVVAELTKYLEALLKVVASLKTFLASDDAKW